MANLYDIGDQVRCSGTFTDSAGNQQDPDAIYAKILDPSGNVASYQYGVDQQVVKAEQGVYYIDVDCDESGWWHYRIYATGVGQSAGEQRFRVRESAFA